MEAFSKWVAALEARHLADLRVPVCRRCGHCRQRMSNGDASHRRRPAAGMCAAPRQCGQACRVCTVLCAASFHRRHRSRAGASTHTRAAVDRRSRCGTGAAGAAWALASPTAPSVIGIDRHPWAVDEANWSYQQLGIHGRCVRAMSRRRWLFAVVTALSPPTC